MLSSKISFVGVEIMQIVEPARPSLQLYPEGQALVGHVQSAVQLRESSPSSHVPFPHSGAINDEDVLHVPDPGAP